MNLDEEVINDMIFVSSVEEISLDRIGWRKRIMKLTPNM